MDVERIDQVVRLQPGDRVLLTAQDGMRVSKSEADQILGVLRERFPGIGFTLVDGVAIAAVQSTSPEPDVKESPTLPVSEEWLEDQHGWKRALGLEEFGG